MTSIISVVILLGFIILVKKSKLMVLIKKSLIVQSLMILFLIILLGYNLFEYKNTFFNNIKIGSLIFAIILTIPYYFKKFNGNKISN